MQRTLLLAFIVFSAGCLQGFGEKVGLAPEPVTPYTMPALADATIRPGVALVDGAGNPFCTSNFLFLDVDGGTVYIGTAAHCVSAAADPDDALASTDTNGCSAGNIPYEPGTIAVGIAGATQPATLAYNSWWSMQEGGEGSATICGANDFALLQLHPDDAARAHPQIIGGSGPRSLADGGAAGDQVYSYGASPFAERPDALRPRDGVLIESAAWSHTAYFVTPGIPGDSGSGVVRSDGAALGILVTVNGIPPGANGLTDLRRALDYADANSNVQVSLLTAT